MVINLEKLGSLNDYIENETFQKLSLDEGQFKININNDIENLKIQVYPSIVDGVPLVFVTSFELGKREKITIESSNVSAMHLEVNDGLHYFILKNNLLSLVKVIKCLVNQTT